MSFDTVSESYQRIERHMKEVSFETPYSFTFERLKRVRELFLKWLDIYKEYTRGYSQELLTRASISTIRMLSFYGVVLERKFSEVFNAKIPAEAYILLKDFFNELGHDEIFYVLAEGDFFEQTSVYSEVCKALLGLTPPGPIRASSQSEVIKTAIRTEDSVVIYYERGQYDNPLAWPLLLHESFHHIYDVERLRRLEQNCPEVQWCREALIDIYITNFFGPAYATSLATYLQRFPYLETISHPDFCARLYTSLLYLTGLMNINNQLPLPINTHITEAFQYVNDIWHQYRRYAPEVQDIAEKIYTSTERDVKRVILEKTQPFLELLLNTEKQRRRVLESTHLDYPQKEILSISDVLEYYERGIPIAVNPRILFNSFISKAYLRNGPGTIFITQCLKKWHIKKMWLKVAEERRS